MKKILITGGAGYLGSHICKLLATQGYDCLAVDHMQRPGKQMEACALKVGDVADAAFLDAIFADFKPDGVIHLAAYSKPLESTSQATLCYRNNIAATAILLETMQRHAVKNLIFASSSMIYAVQPQHTPYPESTPCGFSNPYASSKWMGEQLIEDYGKAYGLRYIIMRHFNPSGADKAATHGQLNGGNHHAVAALTKVALGLSPSFALYGTDYPTPDGTSIRDYVHVTDIAQAHIQALQYLSTPGESLTINIGTGKATSLKELLAAIEAHCGHTLPVTYQPRRAIYQPYLVADITRARQTLNWQPQHSSLENIIETTFRWFTTTRP